MTKCQFVSPFLPPSQIAIALTKNTPRRVLGVKYLCTDLVPTQRDVSDQEVAVDGLAEVIEIGALV